VAGNIRELPNLVERAVILARGDALGLSDLELPSLGSEAPTRRDAPGDERQQIEEALAASRGRVCGVGGAAEALGVPPTTLEARIRRLGIDKYAFRRRVPGQWRAVARSTPITAGWGTRLPPPRCESTTSLSAVLEETEPKF
jgi:formate hydrogenlyase transcriptional activator